MSSLALENGQRFVLIGDSITDCGRLGDFAPDGIGYVAILRGLVTAHAPDLQVEFFNRGIGGNSVLNLEQRWEEDVVALQPDWLSVLIGINDLHQHLGGIADLGPEPYAERYAALLARAVDTSKCSLILLEPFYYTHPPGANDQQRKVFELLAEYIKIVHQLAKDFGARLVRTHEIGQELSLIHI